MAKKINLGKVGITTEGAYDSSKAYEKLSCVTYNHESWVSTKDVPAGNVPADGSAYWQKMSERGEQGIQGPVGPQGNSAFDGNGVEIVNNLTQGGEAAVLSAEQGKILKNEVTELSAEINGNTKVFYDMVLGANISPSNTKKPFRLNAGNFFARYIDEDGCINAAVYLYLYDSNQTFISQYTLSKTSRTFSVETEVAYVAIYLPTENIVKNGMVVLEFEAEGLNYGVKGEISSWQGKVQELSDDIEGLEFGLYGGKNELSKDDILSLPIEKFGLTSPAVLPNATSSTIGLVATGSGLSAQNTSTRVLNVKEGDIVEYPTFKSSSLGSVIVDKNNIVLWAHLGTEDNELFSVKVPQGGVKFYLAYYTPAFNASLGVSITRNGDLNKTAELIDDALGAKHILEPSWVAGYINHDGIVVSSFSYYHTSPIPVKKGQIMKLRTQYSGFCAFAKVVGDKYEPLLNLYGSVGPNYKEHEYQFTEDCQVVVSAYKSTSAPPTLSIGYDVVVRQSEIVGIKPYYNAFNIFDFRTLAGKSEYLYKYQMMSGVSADIVCDIRTDFSNAAREYIQDWSEKVFKFKHDTPGIIPLTFTYTLPTMQEVSKTINVNVVDAPSKKLLNNNDFKVLFIGDSVIFHNQNEIGKEWLRMLNTDNPNKSVDGKAILLPTLNATDGKMRLCGEYGDAANKYTMIAGAYTFFAKRTSASGETTNFENPFYNPNSVEPDEVGENGLNKRVDFGWWFDNNIGEGEYPNLIYLALGPNDFANIYGWSEDGLEITTQRVVTICKAIKEECDKRAGGESNLVIKIIQHRLYPPKRQPLYNFPVARQHYLLQKLAESYINAFKSEGIDSYTELIAAASRFDWEVAYDFEEERYNERYDGVVDDTHCYESVHMNKVGAYNYADVLITDFMADERFD